ncbi:hypothetical protein DSM106972_097130 [Dulcicalothrix desertica PCC 7102]|uniref:Uncharacterized protein n=1 Tax=Dulcicalothrix desertica PCC 7102 TaxID=232991 RepID=A0A3S1A3Q6_9CYAN|nr:hypothetical protein [Dulcicalothrix desertica]RUS93161.1 hypothetical protein DSM106972_097130 [Dulcicalothrix desertica PCC 7102]TWH62849.1 hypothetical protein CAL7102_00388 [Dulcicalothrix desertica PCC 7102]
MTETAAVIPLSTVIPMFNAISDRDWSRFKELEYEFANNYGVETWADVFNFRIMPALEPEAKTWILVQKCSKGYTVRVVE